MTRESQEAALDELTKQAQELHLGYGTDTPISDEEAFTQCVEEVVSLCEQVQTLRKAEINSLRARNESLYDDLMAEKILRYEAEAAVCRERLAIASLEGKLNSETARCAQIAREFTLSPVVGKAIAALILYQNTSQQGQSSNIQVNAGSAGAALILRRGE